MDITGLVGVLNNNSGTIQFVLNELPATIGPLIRTASYGSWFNFYLCSVSGTLTLPGGKQLKIPIKPTHTAGEVPVMSRRSAIACRTRRSRSGSIWASRRAR